MLLTAVNKTREANPMLGLRGVRLGIVIPGLFTMQVRAIAEAQAARIKAGGNPKAEIMIPLAASVMELHLIRDEAEVVLAEVAKEQGVELDIPIGAMIELPRAAYTADRMAEVAEFFSFGTNDLTQTTWGFSRDDVEGAFFNQYTEKGVFSVSPFESIDTQASAASSRSRWRRARRRAPTSTWASAASTVATPSRSTSSTASGSTTCRARRSASRSRVWRPAVRPSSPAAATPADPLITRSAP